MKKNIFVIVLAVLFASQINAQEDPTPAVADVRLSSIDGSDYNIISEYANENVVIASKSDNIYSEVYALLSYKTKKELTPFIFDYIHELNSKSFQVQLGNKYGIVDSKGNYILPCVYELMESVRIGNAGFLQVSLDGKYGIVDYKGTVIIPIEYSKIDFDHYRNNSFLILQKGQNTELKDVVANKTLCTLKCDYAQVDQSNGKTLIYAKWNNKYNIFDLTGKEILNEWYDEMSLQDYTNYVVQLNGKKGIIDDKGQILCPIKYDKIERISSSDGQNLYLVSLERENGLIDNTGKTIIPVEYSFLQAMEYSDTLLLAAKERKYGLLSTSNRIIIPVEYDYLRFGYEGSFIVGKNNKYGVISYLGKILIPISYDEIFLVNISSESEQLSSPLYYTSSNGKANIFDTAGKEYINQKYTIRSRNKDVYYTEEANVKIVDYPFIASDKNGKCGLLDIDGNELLPFEFDNILPINAFAKIVSKKGKYGIISISTKKTILPIEYEFIAFKSDSSIIAYKNKKYELYELLGGNLYPEEPTDKDGK